MADKQGKYPIPFDPNGNQQDYPSDTGYNPRVPPTWIDNFEFTDTLTYVAYHTGRSAIGFELKRMNGQTVNVFISDFSKMIPHMKNGHISGNFTFVKKGSSYGCKLLDVLLTYPIV